MHYSNAEFDRAFKEAYEAVDDAEKTAKYKEAQMLLAQDADRSIYRGSGQSGGGK